jgi:hypothetical protein
MIAFETGFHHVRAARRLSLFAQGRLATGPDRPSTATRTGYWKNPGARVMFHSGRFWLPPASSPVEAAAARSSLPIHVAQGQEHLLLPAPCCTAHSPLLQLQAAGEPAREEGPHLGVVCSSETWSGRARCGYREQPG